MLDLDPYPEYKDSGVSWLGMVPAHWKIVRLRFLTQCLDGKRIPLNGSEREKIPGEIPYWGANRIFDYISEFLFDEDLVLLGEDGAPFFDKNRDVAFFVTGKVWVNNHAHVLRPVGVSPRHLTFSLNVTDYAPFIDGSTRDKLTQSDMGDIPIPVPTRDEQDAIVGLLRVYERRIRALVANKRRLIGLLREQKQAIINHAVTRGIDPNVPLKPSGIPWLGDIPEHWDFDRGKFYFLEVDERSTTGEEELLSVSHITGVTPRSQKNINMFKAESYVGSKICRPGWIAINTMWAWMAALGVSKHLGIISPSYHTYDQLNGRFNDQFLDILLRSTPYKDLYTVHSSGITSSRLLKLPPFFGQVLSKDSPGFDPANRHPG